MSWTEDDMCVPTVPSVFGISLSKVCKVVFSPCLWKDKFMCEINASILHFLSLITLAKPALTKPGKGEILTKFFFCDEQKQKCCKKQKFGQHLASSTG